LRTPQLEHSHKCPALIALARDSRHRFNRVPIRLNQGDLRGAKEDLKAWLLQVHGDDRYLAPTLYGYAAMATCLAND
jgi:hypothetical protein